MLKVEKNLYAGQDTLSDFITHIKEFSDCSEFAKTVLKNNQVLSGRNKAEVCLIMALMQVWMW